MKASEMQDSFLLELIIGSIGAIFIIFCILITEKSIKSGNQKNDTTIYYSIEVSTPLTVLKGSEHVVYTNNDSSKILVKLNPKDRFYVQSKNDSIFNYSIIRLPKQKIVLDTNVYKGFYLPDNEINI